MRTLSRARSIVTPLILTQLGIVAVIFIARSILTLGGCEAETSFRIACLFLPLHESSQRLATSHELPPLRQTWQHCLAGQRFAAFDCVNTQVPNEVNTHDCSD